MDDKVRRVDDKSVSLPEVYSQVQFLRPATPFHVGPLVLISNLEQGDGHILINVTSSQNRVGRKL